MKICEKVRIMRHLKSFSQEEMAEKLGLSVDSYANIERGKTDKIMSKRLKQIVKAFEMEFFDLGERRNVICFSGNENQNIVRNVSHGSKNAPTELKTKLEKAQLIIEAKNVEITYLNEIIELMKIAQAN
ncbi:MAG: helix-turn-helix transcriptional regulator [Methylococcales bacterium]|nr:helix-turn-helix transcriptional regulator [Methylococcales bacterium]MDD5755178.1 helix-turn-helix transcriptional regulator [Methylococcales bacterium]